MTGGATLPDTSPFQAFNGLRGALHLESPTKVTLGLIPDGKPGIMVTLKAMAKLAREGKKNFAVINKARTIVRGCQQKDYACEAASLQAWVRDNIRYVQDPRDVELIQEPQKTIELGAGDCDDKATLLASMLEAIGHQARFVVVATEQAGVFSHVYVETKLGTVWVAAETTEPVPFGWEPPPEIVKSRFNFFI